MVEQQLEFYDLNHFLENQKTGHDYQCDDAWRGLTKGEIFMKKNTYKNAYLVDVGVIVDKDEYPACYSNVYDKKRGYYDEDRYLVNDLDKAKKEALQYVADGVDNTYAIITNQGQRDTLDFDADDSSISYDVADIVYSAIKRNGRIIESFTETSNN